MFAKRTDLALEARELWQESTEKTTRLSGVKATKSKEEGYPVTRVDILDRRGEEALGKPQGTYLTIDLTSFWQRKPDFFERAVRAVGSQLKAMLPEKGPALIVGLGNAAMTRTAWAAWRQTACWSPGTSSPPAPSTSPGSGPWRCSGPGCWAPPAWSPPRPSGAWWHR